MKKQYRKLAGEFHKTKRSAVEFFRRPEQDDWWGNWHYTKDGQALELFLSPDNMVWDVCLSHIKDKASAMYWIAHLSKKRWVTSEMLGNFAFAIIDIKNLDLD